MTTSGSSTRGGHRYRIPQRPPFPPSHLPWFVFLTESFDASFSMKSESWPVHLIAARTPIRTEVRIPTHPTPLHGCAHFKNTMLIFGPKASSEFPSSLLFDDVASFADHLKDKRDHITKSLQELFAAIKSGTHFKEESVRVEEMQARIRELLVNEQANKVEIARLEKEVESANARLTDATVKYLTSEKKVDRLKSHTLAKIERQAMFSANAGSESQKDAPMTDEQQSAKDREISAKMAEGHFADVEQARKVAQAIASKQKEEIQQLQVDNARLSEQVTTFTIKVLR